MEDGRHRARLPLNRQALALTALLLCASWRADARVVEYLYINANEGTASGGHVALKLGEEVFHFQHVSPGLLRIQRDDFAQFRLEYGERENRTIRLHRIEVPEALFLRLRERFNRLLLVENEQFEQRDSLERDRRLLEALLRQTKGEAETLPLKGAGLFLADGWDPAVVTRQAMTARDATLVRLAGKIEAGYGTSFLAAKLGEVLERLRSLRYQADDAPTSVLSEDAFQPAAYSYAERYLDHLEALVALHILAHALPLRDGVLLKPDGAEFRLEEKERQGLAVYQAKLEEQLLRLFRSPRPDWGFASLLGMTRLIALDESIASGRWIFLNLAESIGEETVTDGEAARQAYAQSRSRFISAK